MKKLVAYFSATGTTQTLAENLANGLMFIFRAKSRIFMWNIELKRERHFKNKFGIFLKTLIWQNVLLWRHCLLSCKTNGKTKNVCPSSWCKPNLHDCSMPQSCWQNRQTDRLWWGNRKQKATTIAWKDRKREVLIFFVVWENKKICCVL